MSAAAEPMGTMAAVARLLGPLDGLRVLDIGCGRGAPLAALLAKGARAEGVEPNPEAAEAARAAARGAAVAVAPAEALPFPDASFDAALLLNALHHVPGSAMDAALDEALRVVRPGGRVAVIEPIADGASHRAALPVVDETAELAAAQAALARRPERIVDRFDYLSLRRIASFEAFRDSLAGVDPARAARLAAAGPALRAAFEREARRIEGGFGLDEAQRAVALAV